MRWLAVVCLASGCETVFPLDYNGDPTCNNQPVSCPGYTEAAGVVGSRYRLQTAAEGPRTLLGAQEACNADQATVMNGYTHLFVPGTQSELDGLKTGVNTWVGLARPINGQVEPASTEDTNGFPGSTPTSPPWASGHPDAVVTHNCVQIDPDGLLETRDCGQIRPFICECDCFPAVPFSFLSP